MSSVYSSSLSLLSQKQPNNANGNLLSLSLYTHLNNPIYDESPKTMFLFLNPRTDCLFDLRNAEWK